MNKFFRKKRTFWGVYKSKDENFKITEGNFTASLKGEFGGEQFEALVEKIKKDYKLRNFIILKIEELK